jgi:hypothetical protein
MVGVELDPVSAKVGNWLVPPASRIVHGNLTTATLPSDGPGAGGFDLVAGNVPFAKFAPHAANNLRRLALHNYALVKAARMVRPGGYLVVVNSRYTLDAADGTARDEPAALTNLVAALRLPSDAHAVRAGTAVVTDVLIVHRPRDAAELTGWPAPATVGVDGAGDRPSADPGDETRPNYASCTT